MVDFEKDGDGFVEIPIEKLHALKKKQGEAERQESRLVQERGKAPEEPESSRREPAAEEKQQDERERSEFSEEQPPDEEIEERSQAVEGKEVIDAPEEKPKIVFIDEPKPKIVEVKRNILTQGIPEDRVRLRDLPLAYREQAARDVLPVRNEPDLRSGKGREEAADLAREIYAKKQEEKAKAAGFFGKVKSFLGFN